MNVTREQIERLMDHAGVSYEDAQAALEASDGDLLDALVWLERMGKIPSSGVHSCATDPRVEPETPDMEAEEVLDQEEPDDVLHTVWRWLVDNRLEVYRRDNRARVLECPLAALLALIVLAWWLVVSVCGAPSGTQQDGAGRDGEDRRRRGDGSGSGLAQYPAQTVSVTAQVRL